jgi:putative ABC transport system permease protein
VMNLPLSGANMNRGFSVEGRPQSRPDENVSVDYQVVSPNYFQTLGIPLLRGRAFTDDDAAGKPNVAIISDAMARKYFPGEEPLSKRIAFGDQSKADSWRTIVGVVGNVRQESMEDEPFPTAFTPYRQDHESLARAAIVLRTDSDPSALAAALRREIAAIDPRQPVSHVETMEELLSASMTRPRFVTLLLGVLASVALALATLGVYALLSYTVTERTREIGIRMALGAQRRDVFKMVIGQGAALALVGVAVGLACAFALTRVMSSLLFGVTATDPLTFAGVALVVTCVALVACYLPARRATKVDPMIALRYE